MGAAARLTKLEALDVDSLEVGPIAAALRDIAAIRGRTDQIESHLSRRLAQLNAAGHAPPPADMLGRGGRSSRRSAERTEQRAEMLGHTPELDAALGTGKVGVEHADVLTGVAGRLDDKHREQLFAQDTEITELAASASPEQFRRKLNQLADSLTEDDGLDRAAKQNEAATLSIRVDHDTGMHHLFAKLSPEQGNRVRRSLDAEINAVSNQPEWSGKRRDQVAVGALANLLSGRRRSASGAAAEVIVLIDYDKLISVAPVDGTAEYSDGTPVPAATVRRFACDAGIIPVVLGGDGRPLDVGRARRLATKDQRVALRTMYATCAIAGCDRHFDQCDIHHLLEWDDDGFTDLDNLLPLCSHHHHRAHEGRWRLELDSSTRQLIVRLPTGQYHCASYPDRLDPDTLGAGRRPTAA